MLKSQWYISIAERYCTLKLLGRGVFVVFWGWVFLLFALCFGTWEELDIGFAVFLHKTPAFLKCSINVFEIYAKAFKKFSFTIYY